MKKYILTGFIVINTIIMIACGHTRNASNNLLCSCYFFSTLDEKNHYLEVSKSGVISLYYGSASDDIYYYLSKGEPFPIDAKHMLHVSKDSVESSYNEKNHKRRLDKKTLEELKENIKRLKKKDIEPIFARSKDNPEKIVQLVKKGLYQNGVVLTTAKGQYYFWEEEGSAIENNIIKLLKENSPVPIITNE